MREWMAPDKQLHAGYGAILSTTVAAASGEPLMGFAAGVLAGISKEVIDYLGKAHFDGTGTVDWKDFVATAVGAGIPLIQLTF